MMRVTRKMLTDFCTQIGADPNSVLEIHAEPDQVAVTLGAIDDDGKVHRVTHHIMVDVDDE